MSATDHRPRAGTMHCRWHNCTATLCACCPNTVEDIRPPAPHISASRTPRSQNVGFSSREPVAPGILRLGLKYRHVKELPFGWAAIGRLPSPVNDSHHVCTSLLRHVPPFYIPSSPSRLICTSEGVIVGGDARCVAMLAAWIKVFETDALQVSAATCRSRNCVPSVSPQLHACLCICICICTCARVCVWLHGVVGNPHAPMWLFG